MSAPNRNFKDTFIRLVELLTGYHLYGNNWLDIQERYFQTRAWKQLLWVSSSTPLHWPYETLSVQKPDATNQLGLLTISQSTCVILGSRRQVHCCRTANTGSLTLHFFQESFLQAHFCLSCTNTSKKESPLSPFWSFHKHEGKSLSFNETFYTTWGRCLTHRLRCQYTLNAHISNLSLESQLNLIQKVRVYIPGSLPTI